MHQSLDRLTREERGAIGFYTGGHHGMINGPLRSGLPPDPEITELVALMDSALHKYRLSENARVCRIVGADAFGLEKASAVPELIGREVVEHGYLSTEFGRTPPFTIKPQEPVVLQVTVPPGTPALPVRSLTQVTTENELLLGRGLSYSILSSRYDERLRMWSLTVFIRPGSGGAS
ncbi:ADP-ribosyltransferase [Streptomyces sp. NPDC005970]|uniref:ADP-ribosyltransferase n=1 Tax=Streptomyces sp. NPDC005970 TaxID=3156723 RepID=UPI00340592E3